MNFLNEENEPEQKEFDTNQLIPELIDKFTDYSNNLKDRIKINGIFSEFENNAKRELNTFIKMSDIRYKGLKCGNSLHNMIEGQENCYSKLSRKILRDKFYQTDEIEKEGKKLLSKPDKKTNKELSNLRAKIFANTKDFTKEELAKRNTLLKNALKKRKEREIYSANYGHIGKVSKKNFEYVPNYIQKDFNQQNRNIINKLKNEEYQNYSIENEQMKVYNEIENMMNDDGSKLLGNIKDYRTYLMSIANDYQNGKKITNKEIEEHNFNFLTDDIKMLTYKEDNCNKVQVKKKENPKVDILKLIRYTKRGKSAQWKKAKYNNIKNLTQNLEGECKTKYNNMSAKSNNKSKSKEKSKSKSKKKYKKTDIDDDYDYQNAEMASLFKMDSTQYSSKFGQTHSDFRNTIKTVKSEAEKVRLLKQNFDVKKETMNNFFKMNELPKLSEYEQSIKTGKDFYKPTIQLKKNICENEEQKEEVNANNNNLWKDITHAFENTYSQKKEEWDQQKKIEEMKKIKDLQNKTEINNYLKIIRDLKRNPHYFVDSYSLRDGKINKTINKFNKQVNANNYNRKNMNKKLNSFIEKENQKNKDKMERIQKELKNKKFRSIKEMLTGHEKELEYAVQEKIKENFKLERPATCVPFKYNEVCLNAEPLKKQINFDPYKDYLESLEHVIERQQMEQNKIKEFVNQHLNDTIGKRNNIVTIDAKGKDKIFESNIQKSSITNKGMNEGINENDNNLCAKKEEAMDNQTKLILLENIDENK